jgi:alcohol dehydrogenase (cytochrome c)
MLNFWEYRFFATGCWLFVILFALSGCGGESPDSLSADTADIPQDILDLNRGMELDPIEGGYEDLPTHWLNNKSIGRGMGPVTSSNLIDGTSDASMWLQYGGNYSNYRHSPITSLNPENAQSLSLAWAFPTGTRGQFAASPIVYDGIMYLTSSYNRLFALDATTGELFWRYDHQLPTDLRVCCGPTNRGASIVGDRILMATLDARLIAFNRHSGKVDWDIVIEPHERGYAATSAPLIVKNMAIIGVAGGEFGIRGFFDAYDVETGARLWRHYTVPDKGEPGAETWSGESYKTGGAPTWTQGAYDVETDTLFWTTGNPSPDWNGDQRLGDNLFSDSLLAVDPDTGKLKWYFQFTPHDVWDYDGNTQVFLVDIEFEGKPTKAIVQANRNGFFYVLDRTSGKYLTSNVYLEQVNWATLDDKGRPVVDPRANPSEEPDFRICPSNIGGMNGAWTGSYDPALALAFIPAVESCQKIAKGVAVYIEGAAFMGGFPESTDVQEDLDYGHISAIDVATGEVRWRHLDKDPMMGGVLSTAGGLVITGTASGHVLALESATGKELWRAKIGGGIRSQPIAYQIDGTTYVAVGAGNFNSWTAMFGGPDNIPEGGHLFVFKLQP